MNLEELGIQIPALLLPREGLDLTKWAVIACDQFTSQPEYWDEVEQLVGQDPSTYHLILPEIYLGSEEEAIRLASITQTMRHYLTEKLLVEKTGVMYLHRTCAGKTRRGIMLALDLERYEYHRASKSLIRATEGTILERLPPRIRIREKALVEVPHILVLVDDPEDQVLRPFENNLAGRRKTYDFDLMMKGGHLDGWLFTDEPILQGMQSAFSNLAKPDTFKNKYQLQDDRGVLLFAVGDGNHSLATAKSVWDNIKHQVSPDHPARYALVEIENVHDPALEFHPIHRLVINTKIDLIEAMKNYFDTAVRIHDIGNENASMDENQSVTYISKNVNKRISFLKPTSNLAVGTLQPFLDQMLLDSQVEKIDYIHGDDTLIQLAQQSANAGFLLPGMPKSELFKTVILDGALPRKTFSMGEAHEKRYYMEAKFIQ